MAEFLIVAIILLMPVLLAAWIIFWLFQAAGKMKSPARLLIVYPLIGAVVFCGAYLVWVMIEWSSLGPTAKSLAIFFVPMDLLGVAILGFVASWTLVYVVRFAIERIWKSQPKVTNFVGFVPAAILLAFFLWGVQWSLLRSLELNAAESETTSDESRQTLLNRAIARHDVRVLSLLARNPQTEVADLQRIYNASKGSFNKNYSRDYEVFYSLAQNPHTPPKILAVLATSDEDSTRMEAAENPSTPSDALWDLAGDHRDLVRTCVTGNPNLPLEALQQLSRDQDQVTRTHARQYLTERQKPGQRSH